MGVAARRAATRSRSTSPTPRSTVEGLAGRVAIATDRARDGEAVDGALTLGAWQGVVSCRRRERRGPRRRCCRAEGWVYASTPPVGAGDPGRYHALFGRDSLITALQVLPARPDVARATLRALAALQGERDDPETDEEPGKILHEYRPQAPRLAHRARLAGARRASCCYYGSADSTSWFLVVLAALGDDALSAELEPRVARRRRAGSSARWTPAAASSATARASSSGGLTQQGWRDAIAPVERRTPTAAASCAPTARRRRAPLADADVQAVAYAALRALGVLSGEERWARRAEGWPAGSGATSGPA